MLLIGFGATSFGVMKSFEKGELIVQPARTGRRNLSDIDLVIGENSGGGYTKCRAASGGTHGMPIADN